MIESILQNPRFDVSLLDKKSMWTTDNPKECKIEEAMLAVVVFHMCTSDQPILATTLYADGLAIVA